MITQTITRWINKLFAWWPWRRSSTVEYPQAVNNLNKSIAQEQGWRTTVDGPVPQTGITSLAVEQGLDRPISEKSRLNSEEHSERVPPSPPPKASDNSTLPPTSTKHPGHEKPINPAHDPGLSPTHEQQLAFLRYLVRRGIVNEGFDAGHIPEQYGQEK